MTEEKVDKRGKDVWIIPIGEEKKVYVTIIGAENPEWVYDSFALEREVRDVWFNVQKGDVVLDVGAAFGSYTLYALCLEAGKVIAWEPDKECLFCLMSNFILNNFEGEYYIIPALAGEAFGVHTEYYPDSHSMLRKEGPSEKRLVVPIDEAVKGRKLEKVDWIKIDVEGAEEWVLRGGIETLRKFSPYIIIEYHVEFVEGVKESCNFILTSLDYELVEYIGDETKNHYGLWRKKK